jgi:galactose-1-phosphate uridylyltransferase
MTDSYIKALIEYAVKNGLIEESDKIYCANSIIAMQITARQVL